MIEKNTFAFDGVFKGPEKTAVLYASTLATAALIGAAFGTAVQLTRHSKPMWKGALTGAITGASLVPVTTITMAIAASRGWIG